MTTMTIIAVCLAAAAFMLFFAPLFDRNDPETARQVCWMFSAIFALCAFLSLCIVVKDYKEATEADKIVKVITTSDDRVILKSEKSGMIEVSNVNVSEGDDILFYRGDAYLKL